MDKRDAIKIVKKYLKFVSTKYDIHKAILFGSYAKGTNHIDSDIDVAIIIGNVEDIIDTQIELMKFRRNIDLRIEPHPFIESDFDRTNPVVNEIIKYGIEIKCNYA
ncbi:MAG: nucleotidyltransferase domain-containing protein [Bacteroidota bacterium]